jgi:SPP1 family predicted phage head-tail adaptor
MPTAFRISAGELRHRILIVKPSLNQGTDGSWQIDDSNTVATAWASVKPLSGRDLYTAQQKVSEVTHMVRMRFRHGITANMNVNFNGRFFEIQDVVDVDYRHKVLEMLCVVRDDSARQTAGTAT